ncbi:MAG: hypothetical protein EA411_13395, partial [Saprospirales bacterium]
MARSWLKLRQYIHFSPKLTQRDLGFIIGYVQNPESVESHKFFPFLHYSILKSRKKWIEGGKRKYKMVARERDKVKRREIFYANHLDSQIFAYYSHLLSKKLEAFYEKDSILSDAVIGYRSIKLSKNSKSGKSNIDFAKEVFDFIKHSREDNLKAVSLDISDFFDSLDHKLLKRVWAKLYGGNSLEPDHYAVFKAITRFNFVEVSDIIEEFPELKIKKFRYLREKNIQAYCKSGGEFKERVVNKGLVRTNPFKEPGGKRTRGIPQGSPISSVLSNLYLLDFDRAFSNLLHEVGGIYRRYSDDIVFICRPEYATAIKALMELVLKGDKYKLPIQENKVQELSLHRCDQNSHFHWKIMDSNEKRTTFDYLGFEFDGKRILIRNKGLANYYRRAKAM